MTTKAEPSELEQKIEECLFEFWRRNPRRYQEFVAEAARRQWDDLKLRLENSNALDFRAPTSPARLSREEYAFELCEKVRLRSTCFRGPIGVVVMDEGGRILGTGYPGAPPGEPHCLDVGCLIPYLEAEHCVRTIHAEINAISTVKHVLSKLSPGQTLPTDFLRPFNATAYVLSPIPCCSHCTREMYSAGLTAVRWRKSA